MRIVERRCEFGPEDRPFEEQHATFCIAVVNAATFQYRVDRRKETLVPGSVLLGNPGQGYVCSHEHSHGDHCVAVNFNHETFEKIAKGIGLSAREPSARPVSRRTRALRPSADC